MSKMLMGAELGIRRLFRLTAVLVLYSFVVAISCGGCGGSCGGVADSWFVIFAMLHLAGLLSDVRLLRILRVFDGLPSEFAISSAIGVYSHSEGRFTQAEQLGRALSHFVFLSTHSPQLKVGLLRFCLGFCTRAEGLPFLGVTGEWVSLGKDCEEDE